jgi:hypothetical protein
MLDVFQSLLFNFQIANAAPFSLPPCSSDYALFCALLKALSAFCESISLCANQDCHNSNAILTRLSFAAFDWLKIQLDGLSFSEDIIRKLAALLRVCGRVCKSPEAQLLKTDLIERLCLPALWLSRIPAYSTFMLIRLSNHSESCSSPSNQPISAGITTFQRMRTAVVQSLCVVDELCQSDSSKSNWISEFQPVIPSITSAALSCLRFFPRHNPLGDSIDRALTLLLLQSFDFRQSAEFSTIAATLCQQLDRLLSNVQTSGVIDLHLSEFETTLNALLALTRSRPLEFHQLLNSILPSISKWIAFLHNLSSSTHSRLLDLCFELSSALLYKITPQKSASSPRLSAQDQQHVVVLSQLSVRQLNRQLDQSVSGEFTLQSLNSCLKILPANCIEMTPSANLHSSVQVKPSISLTEISAAMSTFAQNQSKINQNAPSSQNSDALRLIESLPLDLQSFTNVISKSTHSNVSVDAIPVQSNPALLQALSIHRPLISTNQTTPTPVIVSPVSINAIQVAFPTPVQISSVHSATAMSPAQFSSVNANKPLTVQTSSSQPAMNHIELVPINLHAFNVATSSTPAISHPELMLSSNAIQHLGMEILNNIASRAQQMNVHSISAISVLQEPSFLESILLFTGSDLHSDVSSQALQCIESIGFNSQTFRRFSLSQISKLVDISADSVEVSNGPGTMPVKVKTQLALRCLKALQTYVDVESVQPTDVKMVELKSSIANRLRSITLVHGPLITETKSTLSNSAETAQSKCCVFL